MSKTSHISRRTVLRGLGGAALALPFLELMRGGRRLARAGGRLASTTGIGGFPKRLVVLWYPTGTVMNRWFPSGSGSSFELSEILSPLQPHKQDILVPKGIDMESCYHSAGAGHPRGMGNLLTGIEMKQGQFGGGGSQTTGWGQGPSVDQLVANALPSTPFKSLHYGCLVDADGQPRDVISYRDKDQPNFAEDDPYAMFERMFSDLGKDQAQLERVRRKRHSVLDQVKGDLDALKGRLGGVDRQTLEEHAQSVRDLELQLDRFGGICEPPMLTPGVNPRRRPELPQVFDLQSTLLVKALQCDLTRVATLQIRRAPGLGPHPWIGISDPQHGLSHEVDDSASARDKYEQITKYWVKLLADLIAKMKAVPEGEGTLFDNTLILFCTEVANPDVHSHRDMPWLLAGSAGGHFDTGRFVDVGKTEHNNLLLSIAEAMGTPLDTIGNPDYCSGPIAQLT